MIAGDGKVGRLGRDVNAEAGVVEGAAIDQNTSAAFQLHFGRVGPLVAVLFKETAGDGRGIALLNMQAVSAVGAEIASADDDVAAAI